MKIYRDINGKCINIGEWDYKITQDFVEGKIVEVQKNPLPENAYEDEAEILTHEDGSLYVAN
jgi:hypothetical protein